MLSLAITKTVLLTVSPTAAAAAFGGVTADEVFVEIAALLITTTLGGTGAALLVGTWGPAATDSEGCAWLTFGWPFTAYATRATLKRN